MAEIVEAVWQAWERVWLDGNLDKSPKAGIEGEIWMVHSGGFYRTEKIMVAPTELPRHLHWFRWEAALTWITGMILLVVVYYLGSTAFLIDPAIADLDRDTVASIMILGLVGAWVAYDLFWITPFAEKDTRAAGFVSFFAAIAIAWGLTQILPGRAAFIQWMFFVTGSFEPALFPYLRHNVFTPEDERNADQAEATRVAFDEVLDVYDAALQPGPYMLGERFSAADIVTGQALNKAMGFSALDRHERLRDYVQRLRQRPAAIRALDLAGS